MRRNEDVALFLENIAKRLALTGDDPFRIRAYTEAARNISAMAEDVEELHEAGRLKDIPGVGESIAAKIREYLETGHSRYYEELKRRTPVTAVDLPEAHWHTPPADQVHGIGREYSPLPTLSDRP